MHTSAKEAPGHNPGKPPRGKLSIDVLRLRDFRFLLFTRVFVSMALQAQAVIVGWQIYSLTKDPFMLGLTGLTEALPAIVCALFAGHVVDVGRPHRVYLYCLGALFLNTSALLLLGGGYVTLPGGHLLPLIFAGVFLSGVARSFIMPSSFSLLARIVPRKDIAPASAWLSSGFQIAAISGPALAGIVYGGYGPRGAWLLPALLMLMAFGMANLIRPPAHTRAGEKRLPALANIREGWSFLLKHPVLLSMMTLDMFAVLFGGAVAMLPAYADQVLHVGAEGLGALRAAPALGAIVMALILALRPMKRLSTKRLMLAVCGFGLCMIGFGLSKIFALSMLFLMFSGMFDSVSMVMRGTLMQLLTPESMRGRLSAINSMFIISSNEIGAFESGTLARFAGLVPSVVLGGIGTLVVVAIIATSSPKFRRTVVQTDGA